LIFISLSGLSENIVASESGLMFSDFLFLFGLMTNCLKNEELDGNKSLFKEKIDERKKVKIREN
jgi:hypothetical protein